MAAAPVLIIGGGVAGLACARALNKAGRPFRLLESSEQLGGRVRTDITEDGFILDRGFQVLLSAYPEVRRQLDLDALRPRAFRSGAVIRLPDGRETVLRDPIRDPLALPSALVSPIGSIADKLRLMRLVWRVLRATPDDLLSGATGDTLSFLRREGFSDRCLERFLIPFFGGVFLDRSLSADSRFFHFVFQQFVLGRALIPMGGMQRIPEQLASGLPRESVHLSTSVQLVQQEGVRLMSGEWMEGSAVVLAVDGASAGRLLPGLPSPAQWRKTACIYFAAPRRPGNGDGYLRLNASSAGVVHNVCFPSDIAPELAPSGWTLVSVSTHGDQKLDGDALLARVRSELAEWFGGQVDSWRHLRTYEIARALPVVSSQPALVVRHQGVFVCGDYVAYPSLNAALSTGRQVAEELLRVDPQ